jgi:hypothetical protein
MGNTAEDVVVIPRPALRGTDRVLVVDAEGRLYFRQVRILRKDAESVILSEGLEPGERICLSPLDAVVEGMQVRVNEEAP